MVGEKLVIYTSQKAKNAFKLTTMFGENLGSYLSQNVKNAFKLSTMVGEYFEICLSQMPNATCPTTTLPYSL